MSKALSMIKKYCSDDLFDDEEEEENEYTKENNQEYSSFFSNPQIQTSFNLFTKLKKLILRKHNLTMIHFFKKWQTCTTFLVNANYQNRNVIQKLLTNTVDEEDDIYNDIDSNDNIKTKEENIISVIPNTMPSNFPKNQTLAVSLLNNVLLFNMRKIFCITVNKIYLFINRKKLTNNQLTLVYIFTKLAISQSKIKNTDTESSNVKLNEEILQKQNEKIYELERLNKKYENILDEKSNIIISKTDEIEALNEKIEDLQKQIQKNKSLNVIQESICARCGNSLEESFVSESVTETKKVIQEQLAYIDKIEKELKDVKQKNANYELKLKDLDEIKAEFKSLSETLLKEKIDESIQTDPISQPKTVASKVPKKKTKSTVTSSKKKTSNTNINFININNTTTSNGNTSFASSVNSTMTQEFKDSLTSLKFDNSVLSNELLNLNKECTRLRSENRIIIDKNSKFEKEKNELLQKLKTKSDNFEKLKKENEELMVLIQSSKYKNIISTENENKKLKLQVSQYETELSNEKKIREEHEKRLTDNQLQMEKMKKIIEGFSQFKEQKENLILENTKYETETKRIKYDLEEAKSIIEKQTIILNAKDKEIQKLNDDISYYAFNAKKAKQDAEKSIQDAIAYQKIVRKMEKDIALMKSQIQMSNQNK